MNNKHVWIFDIECYTNYFLVMFLNAETGQWLFWEKYNDVESPWPLIIPDGTLVGFNSKSYDMPMLSLAVYGGTNQDLKDLTNEIIEFNKKWWTHDNIIPVDHVDLIEVLPGKASLKIYAGRNGFPRLQDLPIDPATIINDEQAFRLRDYCLNGDCAGTLSLFNTLKPQLELRELMSSQYGVDLRSKSDAQIAEAVLTSEYQKLTGKTVRKPAPDELVGRYYRYAPPAYMRFQTTYLQDLLQEIIETDFIVGKKGGIALPKTLSHKVINIEGTKYKMGIGGIHSMDRPASFYASETMALEDVDVESYYPKIIINNGFSPGQMSDSAITTDHREIDNPFLHIYSEIVNTRLHAKKTGDKTTADSLKITINGSFGKLGSKYSKLYSPNLLIQTTITGQLSLLMLIECFGSRVISANTDGILLYYDRKESELVRAVVSWWEKLTQYRMEYTPYKAYHRRDVNNYLAVMDKGHKGKGCFTKTGLGKNPANEVIYKAVIDAFINGTDVETFIRNHKTVMDFTSLRMVRGKARQNGIVIGKSVRWYWSTRSETNIYYVLSGNIVPTAENSVSMMDLLDELPADIDYDRYIKAATELYEKIK